MRNNPVSSHDVLGNACCVIIIHPGTYPKEVSDVGHAILDCGDNGYVSYFPKQKEKKKEIGRWPGTNHSKKDDEAFYGVSFGDFGQGNTITIPGYTGRITRICLSDCIDPTSAKPAIERILGNTTHWDFNDSNCADLVLSVLREVLTQKEPKCEPCYVPWDILTKEAEIQTPDDVERIVSKLVANNCSRYECVFDPIKWIFS